jgi:hypothetical protein
MADGTVSDHRARVEAFFATHLPRAATHHKDLFAKTAGKVSIMVEGAGAWTLTFGTDPASCVSEMADPDADLLCVWMLPAFAQLLDGKAAPPVACVGDEKLLERLGALLVPPAQGGMNARLAAMTSVPKKSAQAA